MDNLIAQNDVPRINLNSVPPHVADYLAEGVLRGVREFLKRPDGKVILEAKAAIWKAERSVSKKR